MAGAVDEDVDAAVALDDLGDHVPDVADLLDLARDEHALAALFGDLLGDAGGATLVHIEDGDFGAFGREELGGGAADVPAAADDDRNLVV